MIEEFDCTRSIEHINGLLQIEEAAGLKPNGLQEISERRARHTEITQIWGQVQEHIQAIKAHINGLPSLPSRDIIAWAQSVNEMDSLAFLEIDTTGTDLDAELVRFTLGNRRGSVFYDQHIRPEQGHISPEASKHNGITDTDLEAAPTIAEVWPRIQRAVAGHYILSFNQEWDRKTLLTAAQRHDLPPLVIIGECLQRRATAYYFKEYYLDLATVAARMGHTMTGPDAPARLRAQYALLDGIVRGLTDVRPPAPEPVQRANSASEPGDDDELDFDEHPF